MKSKRLVILVLAVVVLGAGLLLYSKRHTFFPSEQMQSLRQLETSLDLPIAKFRSEVDLGYNKDAKGAPHYDRRIALSYENNSVLDTLRTELLKDSWQEHPANSVGSYNYFSFSKGTGNAIQCVNGYTSPKDSDGIVLYIALEASGEYTCNP